MGQTYLLLELSKAYFSNDFFASERYALQAIEQATILGHDSAISVAARNIGVGYALRGQLEDARSWSERSLYHSRKIGNSELETKAVINLIGISFSQGNLLLTERMSRELVRRSIQIRDSFHLPVAHESLGLTFHAQNRLDSAELHLRTSANLYSLQKGREAELANCLNTLAGVLAGNGKHEAALTVVQQSVGLFQKSSIEGANGSYLSAKLQEAKILLTMKRFDQARKILLSVNKVAEDHGLLPKLSIGYLLLSRLDSMQGDYQSALISIYQHNRIQDSLDKHESEERYETLLAESEQTRQNADNVKLKAAEELANAKIENQRLLLFLVLIALAILALLTSELIRRNRQIQFNNERLAHNQTIINLKNQALEKNKGVLIAQKQELEKLNRTKDRWFGIISHDFRHPLTLLQGALQLVGDDEISPTERAMLVKELQVRFNRAANLLDNLLFWAQSQLSGWKFHLGKVKAVSLLDPVLEEVDPWVQDKQLKIEVACPENLEIVTDPNALHLITRNLLHNAIKYSHKGQTVFVAIDTTEAHWTLTVRDQGVGMTVDQVAALFQSEVKSIPGTMNEKGSGLGLLLARDVATALNGKLEVSSVYQQGTTFILRLPKEKAMDVGTL